MIHATFFGDFAMARCGQPFNLPSPPKEPAPNERAPAGHAITDDWDMVHCPDCLHKQGKPMAAIRNPANDSSRVPWVQRARRILAGV